jgi:hypothetical protein
MLFMDTINNVVCNCCGLGDTVPHAYTVTQVTTKHKPGEGFLQAGYRLETESTIGSILRNGTLVAGNVYKIGLCLSRKLQHGMQTLFHQTAYFRIALFHHLGVLDASQEKRE